MSDNQVPGTTPEDYRGKPPQELHTWCLEFHNGTITPERQRDLERWLQHSDEARQRWFLICDIESGLTDWSVEREETRRNHVPGREPAPKIDLNRPARDSARLLGPIWALVVCLLMLLTGFSAWSWWRSSGNGIAGADSTTNESSIHGVAVLARTLNARWRDSSSFKTGAMLSKSTLELQSGAAMIEFFSGAGIILEGPAKLELLSKNQARLLTGKLNATVPPQARGFSIRTSDGEIIDHGTEFGVVLADDAPSQLHVFNGLVELKGPTQTVEVTTGEAVEFGVGDGSVFDADRSVFLSEQTLIRESDLILERRLAQWRKNSRRWSVDPATICHLRMDHDAEDAEPREVVDWAQTSKKNPTAANPSSTNPSSTSPFGTVVGCQWVSGRWSSKPGLLLRQPSDRIRLEIDAPIQVVTLMMWANVQSLTRWQNVLLSSDSDRPGAIRWHLTRRGQLRLQIGRDLGRPVSDWEAVESRPVLTEQRQQAWTLLATTFDGSTIRHYVDGEPVGSGASFTPDSLHLGMCEIGNWSGETQRNLHAIIDELIVLDRVLTDEEILAFYRSGTPFPEAATD